MTNTEYRIVIDADPIVINEPVAIASNAASNGVKTASKRRKTAFFRITRNLTLK